ncbi:hypothetical protein [Cycloclasticus sp.]|nr:hypothetical protein [Cycloclasticus sp.]
MSPKERKRARCYRGDYRTQWMRVSARNTALDKRTPDEAYFNGNEIKKAA